ncbi:MAG TPA: biotin--[acetyl-CoA-carboxylase] ligase [Roseiflexaceae bacterium]|nr:biotin--[acetyl-CoA-carboxylase] ligase [Roseiflexaceae bacterium]
MASLPSDLALPALRMLLDTHLIGRSILRYGRVGSTNDIAKRLARSGRAEGVLILGEEQSAGRGRMGRTWIAQPGQNLLCSLLLRPPLRVDQAFLPTMVAGLALCDAAEQCADVTASLKWPNDLMVTDRAAARPPAKAAGVLSELGIEGERLAWIVIGIGINVNQAPTGQVDGRDLAAYATSLSAAAGGTAIDRAGLLVALLTTLDQHYATLCAGDHTAIYMGWRQRLATLGRHVAVQLPNSVLHGVAEDVGTSGALLLRDDRGVVHRITSGDVQAVARG